MTVRLNAAPQCPLGGDPDRVRRRIQPGKAQPVEMCQPGIAIGEARFRFGREAGNQRGGQRMLSHVAIRGVVEHVIGMTGTKQIEKIQPALR